MEFDSKYFEWACPWGRIFEVISIRRKIGELKGIKFIIHPNEQGHNKGHLHAKYQDKEVVLSIPEGEVISGNISIKQQKQARLWICENEEMLIENWNDLTNGIKIPAI